MVFKPDQMNKNIFHLCLYKRSIGLTYTRDMSPLLFICLILSPPLIGNIKNLIHAYMDT